VDRRLGAFILPALIADPSRDAGAQVLKQAKRVRRLPPTKARAQSRNRPARVRVLLDRQSAKINPINRRMSEGVENGGSGDVEDGPGGGVVLEFCDAVDHEIVGQGLKTGRRDRIAEDIMRPRSPRVRRHRHIARNQAKIATLTRAEHQTVRPEAHRLTVTIRCLVLNLERDQ